MKIKKLIRVVLSWILMIIILIGYVVLFFSTISGDPFNIFSDRLILFFSLIAIGVIENIVSPTKEIDYEKYFNYPYKIILIIVFGSFLPIMMYKMFGNIEYVLYLIAFEVLNVYFMYVAERQSKAD